MKKIPQHSTDVADFLEPTVRYYDKSGRRIEDFMTWSAAKFKGSTETYQKYATIADDTFGGIHVLTKWTAKDLSMGLYDSPLIFHTSVHWDGACIESRSLSTSGGARLTHIRMVEKYKKLLIARLKDVQKAEKMDAQNEARV